MEQQQHTVADELKAKVLNLLKWQRSEIETDVVHSPTPEKKQAALASWDRGISELEAMDARKVFVIVQTMFYQNAKVLELAMDTERPHGDRYNEMIGLAKESMGGLGIDVTTAQEPSDEHKTKLMRYLECFASLTHRRTTTATQ